MNDLNTKPNNKQLEESIKELKKKYPNAYVPKIDKESGLPILPKEEYEDWEYLFEARQKTSLRSNGIYSVLHKKWIKEPVAEDIPEPDQEEVNKALQPWLDRYNEIIRGSSFEDGIETVIEAISQKKLYVYDGPVYRFGRFVKYAHLETKAVSLKQAINNMLFNVARDIGYNRANGANVRIREEEVREADEDEYDAIDWNVVSHTICPKCKKTYLNDAGECPLCDLGDESVLDESFKNTKIEEIEDYIEDVYDLRKSSIANDGEYGVGNLVFKELRNRGILDNLRKLKSELVSREFSLESSEFDSSPKLISEELIKKVLENSGILDSQTLEEVDIKHIEDGWFVQENNPHKNSFSEEDIDELTLSLSDALDENEGKHLYIYIYKDNDMITYELNSLEKDTINAIDKALKNKQKYIYNFVRDEYIMLEHHEIVKKDGNKKPSDFSTSELDEYGLSSILKNTDLSKDSMKIKVLEDGKTRLFETSIIIK